MDLSTKLSTLLKRLDGYVFRRPAPVFIRDAPGPELWEIEVDIEAGLISWEEAKKACPWFFGGEPPFFVAAGYDPHWDCYYVYRYGLEKGIKAESKRMKRSIFQTILVIASHEVYHRVRYRSLGVRYYIEHLVDPEKVEEEAREIEHVVLKVWRATRSLRQVAEVIKL
jgi:hypothetical protein